MRALYAADDMDPKEIRQRKAESLQQFKQGGFYLVDLYEDPLRVEPERVVSDRCVYGLSQRIAKVARAKTPVILIANHVYETAAKKARQQWFNVVHESHLPFPSSGRQQEYRQGLMRLLRAHGWTRPATGLEP